MHFNLGFFTTKNGRSKEYRRQEKRRGILEYWNDGMMEEEETNHGIVNSGIANLGIELNSLLCQFFNSKSAILHPSFTGPIWWLGFLTAPVFHYPIVPTLHYSFFFRVFVIYFFIFLFVLFVFSVRDPLFLPLH
jgi:hypothetical protein